MTTNRVVAIVLAGGQSRRMGRDKCILANAGTTMLEQTQRYLRRCAVQETYISGHKILGQIPDIVQHAGPLAGILATLKYFQSGSTAGILFVPVDMPQLQHTVINKLIECGHSSQKVHCFRDHFLPLFVPCNNSMVEAAQTILEQGNGSIKEFIYRTNGLQLDLPAGDYFVNINTPADWRQFVEQKLTY
jgi:molybdopterin-guanine dinucleotide biosynthesis protein A